MYMYTAFRIKDNIPLEIFPFYANTEWNGRRIRKFIFTFIQNLILKTLFFT